MPRAKRDPETSPKRPSKRAAEPEQPQQQNAPTRTGSASMDEEIRRRAYEIYQARGGQGGTADEDWYRAEQEVRGRRSERTA